MANIGTSSPVTTRSRSPRLSWTLSPALRSISLLYGSMPARSGRSATISSKLVRAAAVMRRFSMNSTFSSFAEDANVEPVVDFDFSFHALSVGAQLLSPRPAARDHDRPHRHAGCSSRSAPCWHKA